MTPNLNDLFFARYQEGGREAGVYDCLGLLAEVYRRQGITLPAYLTPETLKDRQALFMVGVEAWEKLEHPEPWCGVALRIGKYVAHVGVVLEDCIHFIHTNKKTGVTRTRLDDPRWAQRIAGFYRHV
jgi:hypothetical protein